MAAYNLPTDVQEPVFDNVPVLCAEQSESCGADESRGVGESRVDT
jgi:hypothetical protein